VAHRRKREETKRLWEGNENENTIYQNLWDTANAVLRGKFLVMSAYNKRAEDPKQNNAVTQTPRKTRTSKPQNKKERNNKNRGQN
jgi:hypothetical protein